MKFFSPSRDLRVALVASSLAQAGAEKQLTYVARAWRENGAAVLVVYLGNEGHYESALREDGVPIVSLASNGKPWKALWRLMHALVRFRPDIVIAGQFGDLLHAGIAGRILNSTLIVGGVRSDGVWELNTYRRRFGLMIRLSHALVACSRFAKENLVASGVAARKIFLLPNVIDLGSFDKRARNPVAFPFGDSRVVAAAVGRINHGKRFDRFLEALALARKRAPALAGLIIGPDDGERANLEKRALALGLSADHLIFAGRSNDVPALLGRSHLLMLTSDFEGFPNVILEAMAARLPIITLGVGEAGQTVLDQVTGFVVDPPSIEMMATRLVQLAHSPALRAELGEAGRKRVETEYEVSFLPDRLRSLYRGMAVQEKRHCLVEKLEKLNATSACRWTAPGLVHVGAGSL
jgi:glycosyltransferase involved in cell wall biosynthesis